MSPPTIHRNDLCRVEFVIIDLVLTYEPDYHDIFASVNLPDELFLLCLPPVVNLPNLKIFNFPFSCLLWLAIPHENFPIHGYRHNWYFSRVQSHG